MSSSDLASGAAPARPPRRGGWIGTILARLVVPAWIILGALFKLDAANPGLLPRNILTVAAKSGVDLDHLLMVLIAIELILAGVMIFVHALARPLAVLMLVVFCGVLIGEIAAGNGDCGCLGANSPSPWVMLGIDGALLLGLLIFRPRPWTGRSARWPFAAAAIAGIVSVVASTRVLPGPPVTVPVTDPAVAPVGVAPTTPYHHAPSTTPTHTSVPRI